MVYPRGELTAAGYRNFSDTLVKFAIDEPNAVVVILDDLLVGVPDLYTAFRSAALRVGEWPDVPIHLVAHAQTRRDWLRRSAVRLPIFADVSAALRAAGGGSQRHRATLELAEAAECGQRARTFVEEICVRWDVPEVRVDALLIATELVENSFLHSRVPGGMQLRLELRDDRFCVAVGDNDPHEALLREPGVGGSRHYGLHIVARLASSWGCVPRRPAGKVVWAVLPTGRWALLAR
ncbi:ATP-binding protein [Nocardia concava]|uniref:ATP-binding protein n=1 Tax=Nocardia concava TaxID=257281 RepID=UPI0003046947|nr:ATP-binding protein [Nocardia concava]